jgi:hypothetical protein
MWEYRVLDLALMLGALRSFSRDLSTSDQLAQPICTKEKLSHLATVLDGLRICCENFKADPSLVIQIAKFQQDVSNGSVDSREAVILARINAIVIGINNNLDSRTFMFVPADQAVYWNSFFWCGDEFLRVFPHGAKAEATELGNCIAAGRWTACVFHSMRLVEHGLRKLATALHVKLKDKGKPQPIVYATWNKIIVEIKNKITTVRQRPQGLSITHKWGQGGRLQCALLLIWHFVLNWGSRNGMGMW